jgi:hypothetical protein
LKSASLIELIQSCRGAFSLSHFSSCSFRFFSPTFSIAFHNESRKALDSAGLSFKA